MFRAHRLTDLPPMTCRFRHTPGASRLDALIGTTSRAQKLSSFPAPRGGGTSQAAPEGTNSKAQTGRTAFLLEDNIGNGQVIDGILDLLGYEHVTWVGSLAETRPAVPDLVAGRYDLVLLDLMLPDGESFDLLSELKAKGVPRVCMYTARTATEDTARMWAAGCDEIFEKPLTISKFMAAHDGLFGARGA